MALNPHLPEAYVVRARLLWRRSKGWQHEAAVQAYTQALSLNPSLDEAYFGRGVTYSHVGLLDKALQDYEKGILVNPANTQARFEIGANYLVRTNYERALFFMTNYPPRYAVPIKEYGLAQVLHYLHRTNEALGLLDGFLSSDQKDTGGLVSSMHAVLMASAGQRQRAHEDIQRAQEFGRHFGHFHHTAYSIASAFALLNEPAKAIEWLRAAASDGYPNYFWFERDPNLVSLRSNDDFKSFMAEQRSQWEKFNASL